MSQNRFIEVLMNDIKNRGEFDFVFFTGDFANKGNTKDIFEAANLLLGNNFNLEKIIFTPGNHDIDRKRILPVIDNYLNNNISDNEELNVFTNNEDEQFLLSCAPLEDYYSFQKSFFSTLDGSDTINRLFSVHNRKINEKKIGIVSINSSWHSNDNEYGKLLFPLQQIYDANRMIKEVDCKILLLHHPLSCFKDFNQFELEDFIYNEFHFMFVGHFHKFKHQINLSYNEGIFTTTAPAVLTPKKDDEVVGYTIFDIDLETFEIIYEDVIYSKDTKTFHSQKHDPVEFPHNHEKQKQNKFRKRIRELHLQEMEDSNDLFISVDDLNANVNFLELFESPVLKSKSEAELIIHGDNEKAYKFESMYFDERNLLVIGNDKSGRTSLLKRIHLELLGDFTKNAILPFYIDCKTLKSGKYDLLKSIGRYYNLNKGDMDAVLSKYKVKLLIDNLEHANTSIIELFCKFINENTSVSLVACIELSFFNSYSLIQFDSIKLEKLYIHNITLSQVRSLTKKWLKLPDNKNDEIVNRIGKVFKQLHLPFNFWTVSIFIWIFDKTKDVNFSNNSELLSLYIENVLDRKSLALDTNNRFKYDNYIDLLSFLSLKMFKSYSQTNYRMPYEDLLKYTKEFLESNIRRVASSQEVIEYIVNRKLLKKKDDLNYGFRLNGVFEYFLANAIVNDSDFKNFILENDEIFLSFRNELELYAGINKKERSFLSYILGKTQKVFEEVNDKYNNLGSADNNLTSKVVSDIDFKVITEHVGNSKPLSIQELDELSGSMDFSDLNAEIKLKEPLLLDKNKNSIRERYLHILSRVFKNMDGITDEKIVKETFDFIITSYINMGFLFMDEFNVEEITSMYENKEIRKEEIEPLIESLKYFIPMIVQSFIFSGIGHVNFEKIILERIEKLNENHKNNQYELFILFLLLIEIDIHKNKEKCDDLLKIVDNPVLRSCILMKISHFYIFKSYSSEELAQYFKSKIRELQFEKTPNEKKRNKNKNSQVNGKISELEYRRLLQKQKNREDKKTKK